MLIVQETDLVGWEVGMGGSILSSPLPGRGRDSGPCRRAAFPPGSGPVGPSAAPLHTAKALRLRITYVESNCTLDQSSLKGQSNEIFDLQFFSSIEPAWATDQWVKIFSNLVRFLLSYSNFYESPRGMILRRVNLPRGIIPRRV